MTYIKTLWKDGVSLIDAEKMNKLEEGTRQNSEDITNTNTKFDRRVDETNTNLSNLSDSTDRRFQEANDKMNVFDETLEGDYVTCANTIGGIVKNIEVLGKTYQNPSKLDEIKATGVDNGDGTWTYEIVSCGENLFDDRELTYPYLVKDSTSGKNIKIIKIKPNTTYTLKCIPRGGSIGRLTCILGDALIKLPGTSSDQSFIYNHFRDNYAKGRVFEYKQQDTSHVTFTTYEDSKYIYINADCAANSVSEWQIESIKLQAGTVTTPYTSYEEDKVSITLPCQLEEYDQLYYDKSEGAWCVNKYNTLYEITGAEEIIVRQDILVSERSAFLIKNVGENIDKAITNKFRYLNDDSDVEHFRQGDEPKSILVFVNKSSLSVNSVEGFRSWAVENGLFVKYPTNTPKKVVLPKDVQIQLNQMSGTTNVYIESGDVDAKLKITFNKSLGSAVQSNSKEIEKLDVRVADIEGLKESQDFSYQTDKGYLVCKDTQNGVVKDLKIYGKSLVNLWNIHDITLVPQTSIVGNQVKCIANGTFVDGMCLDISKIKTNTDYTVIFYVSKNTINSEGSVCLNQDYQNESCFGGNSWTISGGQTGMFIRKLTSKSSFAESPLIPKLIRTQLQNNCTSGEVIFNCVILEGDHTQNPPGYFEGIASVGNGNEIEVFSRKEDGNLCSLVEIGGTIGVESHFGEDYDMPRYFRSNYINVEGATEISYSFTHSSKEIIGQLWCFYDKNKKGIMPYLRGTTVKIPSSAKYVRFEGQFQGVEDVTPFVEGIKLCITKSETPKPYTTYKSDKKPVLFKDADGTWKPVTELRGIDLNACDTIEEHSDGKHYLHVRTKLLKINGDVGTISIAETLNNVYHINITSPSYGNKQGGKSISSAYRTDLVGNEDIEHMRLSSDGIIKIFLDKTKIPSATPELIKNYLNQNAFDFIYELKEEKVYEVNPLDLESYNNETMALIEGGVIPTHIEFKITSNIVNLTKNIQDRVNRLENDLYKQNLATLVIGLNTLNNKLELEGQSKPQTV